MAIQSVTHDKAGPRRHIVTVVDDDGELTERIIVPDPLPEEFTDNADYVKTRVRRMVKVIRSRKASDDERSAERDKWAATTNQDTAGLLTDLQTELDA